MDLGDRERAGPRQAQDIDGVAVAALDHVHLYVAEPETAAGWYRRILGLKVHESTGHRRSKLGGGLYMATDRGQYCATIFHGKPPSDGDHTTAFRVTGTAFIAFGEKLSQLDIPNRKGGVLTAGDAADHELAFSYYFQDPDGNHLELTTYDHARVRAWFRETAAT